MSSRYREESIMKNIIAAIRRAPKRLATLLVVAAAVIVPATLFAWGPDRPTFTFQNPAPYVTFNSITNNPDVGDERNFVRIKESGTNTTYTDNVALQPGKTYEVMTYYHNNANTALNASGTGVAKDAKVRIQMPATVAAGATATVSGFVDSPSAKPTSVWDSAYATSSSAVALRYVQGSAKITSNGAVNGATLPDSLFTTGTNLGYDSLNGVLKGCNQYAGYVTFKFTVDQPNFTVAKQVSVDDGKSWSTSAPTTTGSTVLYRIIYTNTGTTQQDNVTIRDMLPAGVSYVPGSTLVANAKTGGAYKATVDGVTANGFNIGSYAPTANAYLKFSAKVTINDYLAACGPNTLKNVGRATTTGGYKEATADVIVNKECTPPTPAYTCNALSVQPISRTQFKFATDYSVKNATFKNVTYVIRDANGKEVERKTSTAKTLDYTRTTVGKYTVQAIVTVTVNGQDKTVTSDYCKQPFEVTSVPSVPVYTCDALSVKRISRTEFTFTTAYTVKDATFKNVTYIIRDAKGNVVERKTSTAMTLTYTRSVVGNYTVEAVVTVTVKGTDKTVTSANCKKAFEVPSAPEYCAVPGKEQLPKNSPDCVVTPEFCTVVGKETLPKNSPDCVVVTPPELPHTGAGQNIAALLGLGALIASIGYYVASRRALSNQ
jgi:uncharacterized repeat protein (TIGR01451 family)/LPXTG-motif cell wall-anchored protein